MIDFIAEAGMEKRFGEDKKKRDSSFSRLQE